MSLLLVNDIQIAYSDQGSGETVVLLHGLGSLAAANSGISSALPCDCVGLTRARSDY